MLNMMTSVMATCFRSYRSDGKPVLNFEYSAMETAARLSFKPDKKVPSFTDVGDDKKCSCTGIVVAVCRCPCPKGLSMIADYPCEFLVVQWGLPECVFYWCSIIIT